MGASAGGDGGAPMGGHFSAFSFVDRITAFEPGRRARGEFVVPAHLPAFPACLAAEAVGQLAAWIAMAQVGFRRRPVAGLAGETRFLGAVTPGARLDLEVELESCDDEAVAYGGSASVGGVWVLELGHCVGPMLPLADFDAPEAVARRFEVLRDSGAPGGGFHGVAPPEFRVLDRRPGECVRAEMQVPAAAPFFADHFPRRPVFPGTLLLDSKIRLAMGLADELSEPGAQPFAPSRVTDVKIRSFIAPGQAVELEAQLARTAGGAEATLTARANGKQIAIGRLELARRESA
jgi:3-hydroxymyristoyl/3-hydroxydecanoyl-(acyl carrier protein) dehydratase